MIVSGRLVLIACCAALFAGSLDAAEGKRNRLGVRFWMVGAESDNSYGEKETGILTSLNYNHHLASCPWIFTSKLGWGKVGSNLIDLQFGGVRYWSGFALGAGYHFIDYSQSYSGGGYSSATELGTQHGFEVLASLFGSFPETDAGYRISCTFIPILTMEDYDGTGYVFDAGITYRPGNVAFGVGVRHQVTTFENDQYYSSREIETTYSGAYVEALGIY